MAATNPGWVGLDMYLYVNTGTYGSPTWVLVDNCQDLKRSETRDEAELNSRKSDEKQKEPTLADVAIAWNMIPDETDTNYVLIRTNEEGRILTELALANQPIAASGCVYSRREVKFFEFSEDQPLAGGLTTAITAKPCKGARKSRVTVA